MGNDVYIETANGTKGIMMYRGEERGVVKLKIITDSLTIIETGASAPEGWERMHEDWEIDEYEELIDKLIKNYNDNSWDHEKIVNYRIVM